MEGSGFRGRFWIVSLGIYRVHNHHSSVVDSRIAVIRSDRNELGPTGIHGYAFDLGVLDVVVQADQTHFALLANVRLTDIELAVSAFGKNGG